MIRFLVGLLGIAGVMAAAALFIGGGAIFWVDTAITDEEGFITMEPTLLETDTYAITTQAMEVEPTSGPIRFRTLATVRIQAENVNPQKGVFIGVAEEDDLEDYLRNVPYAEIEDYEMEPFEISLRVHPGELAPQSPSAQTFWSASSHGKGPQTLLWGLERGECAVGLMNDDASSRIEMETAAGIHIPLIRSNGMALLVAGGVALALGIMFLSVAL